MSDLSLACLYSYGCRMAEEKAVNNILLSCINEANILEEKVVSALRRLQSFYGYKIIAKLKSSKDVFERKIVHSYWLGDFRSKFLINHNVATLEKIKVLKKKSLVNCSVSHGKILGLYSDFIEVHETGLMLLSGKVVFSNKERRLGYGFLSKENLRKGLFISIHINIAREVISKRRAENLELRTKEALTALAL